MKINIDDNKSCFIERADSSQAEELIEFIKKVSDETDNLTFSSDEFDTTVQDEKDFIKKISQDNRSLMLVARVDNKIVGNLTLNGNSKKRLSHKAEFGISVLKEYWGLGIGKALLNEMIDFAQEVGLTKINLGVREDNKRAIGLYKKMGFTQEGLEKKAMIIDGEYIDNVLMGLLL